MTYTAFLFLSDVLDFKNVSPVSRTPGKQSEIMKLDIFLNMNKCICIVHTRFCLFTLKAVADIQLFGNYLPVSHTLWSLDHHTPKGNLNNYKWSNVLSLSLEAVKEVKNLITLSFLVFTWQLVMTKGLASQSLSKTCPVGQANVRLKPTGGANTISFAPNPT